MYTLNQNVGFFTTFDSFDRIREFYLTTNTFSRIRFCLCLLRCTVALFDKQDKSTDLPNKSRHHESE